MLIFVILFIIVIIFLSISFKSNNLMPKIIWGISSAIFIILLIVMISYKITQPLYYIKNNILYNSLTYQLEHNVFGDDNINKVELYEKITNWNADLAVGKAMQNNIWIGAFWHNYYDEFEFIEFPEGG